MVILLFSFTANSTNAVSGKNEKSIQRAYQYAIENGFKFPKNELELNNVVQSGEWVKLDNNNPYYRLVDVQYPYVRPEVKSFVEHISPMYKKACGEMFFVTGGSRHKGFRPPGSHENSVHNAGTAVDLRNSTYWISEKCLTWLNLALNKYKELGLIDYFPEVGYPHFHVMLYAKVEDFTNLTIKLTLIHKVSSGETLSSISRKYRVPLGLLVSLNNISNINEIKLNQELLIP